MNNNADRTIEEDLYEPSTKKNPGQAGYEPPSAGNPQGYKYGEDPAAVPAADKAKGSGVSGAIGRWDARPVPVPVLCMLLVARTSVYLCSHLGSQIYP